MDKKVQNEHKSKKGKIVKNIFLTIFIILAIAGVGFLIFKLVTKEEKPKAAVEIKELDNLEEYKYALTDKDSEYFKAEYDILKGILTADTVDEEKYVTQVARMFVIDLYTLSTKVNKYNIGGLEYYHSSKRDMFEQKAMDTLYSTLLDDTYGDRKQVLPEVSNIETVSVEKSSYLLGDKEVDSYLVKLNIGYVSNLGYDDEASIMVVKEDDKKWSVVDLQPTMKPKYDKKEK